MLAFLHVRPSPLLGRGLDVDFPMLAGCLGLLGLGLVMITSASSEVAAADVYKRQGQVRGFRLQARAIARAQKTGAIGARFS